MQNDKIYSEITHHLARSKTEANYLIEEIEKLETSLYKTGEGNFDSVMEDSIRAKTAYAITQSIGATDKKVFLKELKDKVKALTYLRLTVAFEPSIATIGRIYSWVNQNLGEGVAVDIAIDKNILGGANIEYKGKIGNFSLIDKVNKYFNQ